MINVVSFIVEAMQKDTKRKLGASLSVGGMIGGGLYAAKKRPKSSPISPELRDEYDRVYKNLSKYQKEAKDIFDNMI